MASTSANGAEGLSSSAGFPEMRLRAWQSTLVGTPPFTIATFTVTLGQAFTSTIWVRGGTSETRSPKMPSVLGNSRAFLVR